MFRSMVLRVVYALAVKHADWRSMSADIVVWQKQHPTIPRDERDAFVALAQIFPEFRTQIYFRFPRLRRYSWLIGPEMLMCYLGDAEIGPGLYIEHGWSTAVGVRRAGRNFHVNQQVTIGHGEGGVPLIGDNVQVRAGAKVFGGITIGDNVVIGANAVVCKDVPSDCVVVGVPARIVRRNGVRCDEPLGASPANPPSESGGRMIAAVR